MCKIPKLSEPATYIYNLEIAFDPKSAFNYHCSYTGEKKKDSIIFRTQQGYDQYYLMSTVILRLLLLIVVGLLSLIVHWSSRLLT